MPSLLTLFTQIDLPTAAGAANYGDFFHPEAHPDAPSPKLFRQSLSRQKNRIPLIHAPYFNSHAGISAAIRS